MEYNNKPIPNQSCRRFLKNLLKNLSRTENFKNSQWRHLEYIPELLELGIAGTYYCLQCFIRVSNKHKINYARILMRLGRVAKNKNALISLLSIESIIRCGYCIYYHNNHQYCTYHQIGTKDYNQLKNVQCNITEIQKIPFIILKNVIIGNQNYLKPFVVN